MPLLLVAYLTLRLGRLIGETWLAVVNRAHALEPGRLAAAGRTLGISAEDMARALAYSGDRHRFDLVVLWIETLAGLAFVASGGAGLVERWARAGAGLFGGGSIVVGLAFFGILAVASTLLSLPAGLVETFHVEEKHGFNRQTPVGFFLDRAKGLALAAVLGGPLLAAVLFVMDRLGPSWWFWAWGLVVAFELFAAWIYPSLLAPLFNRFSALPEGELRQEILALARRTGFRAGGVFVMDASRRSAHGNAYFTGILGQKRIVLFDTLIAAMGPRQVVAVLAHELGHFQLRHVRFAIARGVAASGVVFFLLSRALPHEAFYAAFDLGHTNHGALFVFGLWFSLLSFPLQPFENALSRRQELAADAFAVRSGATASELGSALLRLRETSRLLPVSHPLYSWVYHSHPPLLERLRVMGYAPETARSSP